MNRSRQTILFSTLCVLFIAGVMPAFSQAGARVSAAPSYEAILQVVVGSDEPTAAAKLPKNLSAISTYLNENYSFSRYHLANTFIGRVANAGGIEYKSLTDIFGRTSEGELPTFLDWNLMGVQAAPAESGGGGLQVHQFRFGARVPIKIVRADDDSKTQGSTVYEPVGLIVNRLAVPENRPTMIGTISLPKTSGTVFLVLTIRPAAN